MAKKIEDAPIACDIEKLRPTQLACGFQEVEAKQWEILRFKRDELEHWLKRHPIPVVAGPDGKMYLIDRHHMGLALLRLADRWNWEHRSQSSAPNPYETCFVKVKIDMSARRLSKEEFFAELENAGCLHPYDENGQRCGPESIPRTLADLRNDPYRALAGFARKAGGFSKSPQPYSEFRWAGFFRDKIPSALIASNLHLALAMALDLCCSPQAAALPGYTGLRAPGLDIADSDLENPAQALARQLSLIKAKKPKA